MRRVWPDRLHVAIEEHRPLALWGDGRLMNTHGELYAANLAEAEEDGPLPEFAGPPGSELDGAARFAELGAGSRRSGARPVAVSLSSRYAWSARLDDGTTLLLGREQGLPIEERVDALGVGLSAGQGTAGRRSRRWSTCATRTASRCGQWACWQPPIAGPRRTRARRGRGSASADAETRAEQKERVQRMARDTSDLIVGLDIGTSKIVAIVAQMLPDGRYEIVGLGQHESKGLKKGVVVNIESTVASIQRALEEAELMADCKIRTVYTGIAGSHIRSFNSSGMVAIKDKEVTEADMARVIETAKAVNIPTDQQILHVLPQEFIIDGQEDIREPIGMSGVRLEVKVHIVTGAVSAAQNIVKCVRRCGLEVQDLILQPLASSMSVLTAGREGARRGAGRHRRRHHRHRDLHRRRDPPHRGDPDRRRPDHQRHRDGAAHAHAGGRGDQAAARPGQAGARRPERRRSRCPAWAIAARASCRARRSPR